MYHQRWPARRLRGGRRRHAHLCACGWLHDDFRRRPLSDRKRRERHLRGRGRRPSDMVPGRFDDTRNHRHHHRRLRRRLCRRPRERRHLALPRRPLRAALPRPHGQGDRARLGQRLAWLEPGQALPRLRGRPPALRARARRRPPPTHHARADRHTAERTRAGLPGQLSEPALVAHRPHRVAQPGRLPRRGLRRLWLPHRLLRQRAGGRQPRRPGAGLRPRTWRRAGHGLAPRRHHGGQLLRGGRLHRAQRCAADARQHLRVWHHGRT